MAEGINLNAVGGWYAAPYYNHNGVSNFRIFAIFIISDDDVFYLP